MFISHFNRYFEKHAKLTYFVLLVIIIATFVIFVTPGSMTGGQGRLTNIGKMYGKTLRVDKMQAEMAKSTLALWFQNPDFFGVDLSSQRQALFDFTLERMRVLHYAAEKKLDKVTDDEMRDYIKEIPIAKNEAGVFDKVNFERLLGAANNMLQISGAGFDEVVRESIIIDRVAKQVTDSVTVADSEVDDLMAQFTLKCATIPVSPKDSVPSEEEIQEYFASRRADIKLPESKNALAAVFRYDAVSAAMGDAAIPTEDEIKQRYEANKNTVYKDKSLEEVTAAIRTSLSGERVRAKARSEALTLYRDFQGVVDNEEQEARVSRYTAQAEKLGATVTPTGVVALGDMVGSLGSQKRLADAIRGVSTLGGVTSLVVADEYVAVAMVTSMQATQMPDALPALAEESTPDALRAIIIDAITREKALDFFQKNVKAPYDAFIAGVEQIRKSTASDQQKQTAFQELQHAFDLQLVSDFVVYENRSFVQVTFDGQRYLDQVPEPTEEKIAAAYEAKKADFDGKTLDDVRETLAAELKAAAARNRADEAAVKFASDLADAWWKAVEKDADANPAELTAKMGEAIPQAHVSTVEKMDVLQQNSSNSELAGALFSLTMTTPISSAILGQDASYVICLTGIEKQHLADPATDPASYQTLAHVYRESVEMAAAKTRAEAETKRVADALAANEGDFAAAAADLQFTDLPSFSVSDIYNQSAVVNSVRQSKQLQLDALAEELPKVKAPGVFLAPHKAQQVFSLGSNMQSMVIPVGYQILYVANRTVPEKSETNAAEREKLHDGLLAMKQSAELKNFYQMLLEQSDTELVPNTPFTASMPEEEEE